MRPRGALALLQPRLAVEHLDGAHVEVIGGLDAVGDAHHAQLAELGERADQVEDHPLLRGAVKMQLVVDRDLDQVLR